MRIKVVNLKEDCAIIAIIVVSKLLITNKKLTVTNKKLTETDRKLTLTNKKAIIVQTYIQASTMR